MIGIFLFFLIHFKSTFFYNQICGDRRQLTGSRMFYRYVFNSTEVLIRKYRKLLLLFVMIYMLNTNFVFFSDFYKGLGINFNFQRFLVVFKINFKIDFNPCF